MRHNSGNPTNTHAAGRREISRRSLLCLRLPKPRERRCALSPTIFSTGGDLGQFTQHALHFRTGGRGPPWYRVSVEGDSRLLLLRPRPRRVHLLMLRFSVWCWFRPSLDCGDFVLLFSYAFRVESYRGFGSFVSDFLVWRWAFLCAVVSWLRLVSRVRRTSSDILN